MLSLIVPVDMNDTPPATQSVLGSTPAQAQTPLSTDPIVDGTPEPCPPDNDTRGWVTYGLDDSFCKLELDACPEDPVVSTIDAPVLLSRSDAYPDFCEATYDNKSNFSRCRDLSAPAGYTILFYDMNRNHQGGYDDSTTEYCIIEHAKEDGACPANPVEASKTLSQSAKPMVCEAVYEKTTIFEQCRDFNDTDGQPPTYYTGFYDANKNYQNRGYDANTTEYCGIAVTKTNANDDCPENPLEPPTLLIQKSDDRWTCLTQYKRTFIQPDFQSCQGSTGYVIQINGTGSGQTCRIMQIGQCPDELVRVSDDTCQIIERRTWECPTITRDGKDYTLPKRNKFPTCYQEPAETQGTTHPACGNGAPSFALIGCAEFVGEDYTRSPTTLLCSSYDTGEAQILENSGDTNKVAVELKAVTNNGYWCSYPSTMLDIACHQASPSQNDCPPNEKRTAKCIKRAGGQGGCDAIAQTILCRDLQSKYATGVGTADNLAKKGCQPCVPLPFRLDGNSIPACNEDRSSTIKEADISKVPVEALAALRVRGDFDYSNNLCSNLKDGSSSPSDLNASANRACRQLPVCSDPYSRGRLTYRSTHPIQQPIVNSLIKVRVTDLPNAQRSEPTWQRYFQVQFDELRRGEDRKLISALTPNVFERLPDLDSPELDARERVWFKPRSISTSYSTISQFLDHTQVISRFPTAVFGECSVAAKPHFRLQVTELWPGNDDDEIKKLFGDDALAWWDSADPSVKSAYTATRGNQQTVEVDCSYEAEVWCDWIPAKPGYYRLIALGGWKMTGQLTGRSWLDDGVPKNYPEVKPADVPLSGALVSSTDDDWARSDNDPDKLAAWVTYWTSLSQSEQLAYWQARITANEDEKYFRGLNEWQKIDFFLRFYVKHASQNDECPTGARIADLNNNPKGDVSGARLRRRIQDPDCFNAELLRIAGLVRIKADDGKILKAPDLAPDATLQQKQENQDIQDSIDARFDQLAKRLEWIGIEKDLDNKDDSYKLLPRDSTDVDALFSKELYKRADCQLKDKSQTTVSIGGVDTDLNEACKDIEQNHCQDIDDAIAPYVECKSIRTTNCPSLDIRIKCKSKSTIANYTESDPIGVYVYEIRTSTR